MDSVSRLYAISQMKGVTDLNFKLFAGYPAHCSKKPTDYSNCCKLNGGANNWGHNLGAHCTQDEQNLIEQRKKNLCVYAGKSTSGSVLKVNKHHWCCFGNILNKVLQIEGRKQLMPSTPVNELFGKDGNTDCRGLTLEELLTLDFDRMDFTEFEAEILKKMKLPKDNDLQERVKSSMPNVQKPKDELTASENRRDGVNSSMVDDSWEAMEEKRLEEERKRELAQLEEEKKLKQEEEKRKKEQRKIIKEEEVKEARRLEQVGYQKFTDASMVLASALTEIFPVGSRIGFMGMYAADGHTRIATIEQMDSKCSHILAYKNWKIVRGEVESWQKKRWQAETDLKSGNY